MAIIYMNDEEFGSLVEDLKAIDLEDEQARDDAITEVLLGAGIAPASYEALWRLAASVQKGK